MKKTLNLAMTGLLTLSSTSALANSVNTDTEVGSEVSTQQYKKMSADMKIILDQLESDYEFIGKFLDDPSKVILKYDLTEQEKMALSTRSVQELMNLGLEEEQVSIAMSGTHRGGYLY